MYLLLRIENLANRLKKSSAESKFLLVKIHSQI